MTPQQLLLDWLRPYLGEDALAWLSEKAAQIAAGAPDKILFTAFSAALRHAGKLPLAPAGDRLPAAEAAAPGWRPDRWTRDQAARTYLLLALPAVPASGLKVDQLYQTADVGEAVALQQSLPLLPLPETHMGRAREGVRSNIKPVFEAVALRNPYPARHFDETGWNQMVVKCLFTDSPMEEIEGLEARANPALSRILVDLVKERWAAGRVFDPQLWRCVGPHADEAGLDALEKAYRGTSPEGRRAAALALSACPNPRAARILAADPALAGAARARSFTWENLHHGD